MVAFFQLFLIFRYGLRINCPWPELNVPLNWAETVSFLQFPAETFAIFYHLDLGRRKRKHHFMMLLSSDNLTNLKFVASLLGFAQSKAQHMAT